MLRTETELTLVSVSVTDPSGSSVTGLERDNFRIFENGTAQQIVRFASEDVPVSIGAIFDVSESMSDKIYESGLAALKFFVTANPEDEFFLVDFNDRAQLVSEFPTSHRILQAVLKFLRAAGAWSQSHERGATLQESLAPHLRRR